MSRDNLIISFGEWQPWFWFGYEATVQEVDLTATTLLDTGKKNKKKVSVWWILFFFGGGAEVTGFSSLQAVLMDFQKRLLKLLKIKIFFSILH